MEPNLTPEPGVTPKLSLTPAARDAAQRDLRDDEFLRIAFAGGCGAMGFRLSASRRGNEDDVQVVVEGVHVHLDRLAVRELEGAVLDFDDDEGFVLDHPRWGISC